MKETKTVAQSLRHARHDFLNELQLINMYLDLGRQEEAQAIIRSHAEAAMHLSRLSGLKMPMTEEWLLLSKWQHPEFHFRVECLATKGITEKRCGVFGCDGTIRAYRRAEAGSVCRVRRTDPFEK
ncbi:Spo0B domain-containing protein [Planomicrobium chinense]|uniref:Spo0B domain-containing protein n=1 Tax=Planococcus chinensis TaxID=272917 RepID=UPI001CC7F60B|nr:Spo0B domain-containing protein [Planococcus chinensis]MBZ5201228.1 Spo0B domain-containing protein [Planococcus chinensis]